MRQDEKETQIRLLLVEDDPESGEAMRFMLKRRGVIVTLVESAGEAAALFDLSRFEAVVSDIRLEGNSGVEVLRHVRGLSYEFPVILLTAYDSVDSAIEAVKLGAQDYILKPLDSIDDLLGPVKKALHNYRLFVRNRSLEEELRSFAVRLQSIREDEQTRISRAIHDEFGQSLTALKMDLVWIDKRIPAEAQDLRSRLKAMQVLSNEMLASVQRISAELRPAVLDDLGIAAALEWQAGEFGKHSGIECVFNWSVGRDVVYKELSTALFRITQEALTNIARHAQATEVSISVSESDGRAVLEIEDNGIGITDASIEDRGSLGLIGMRERALALGGEIEVTRVPSGGTSLVFAAPLDRKE